MIIYGWGYFNRRNYSLTRSQCESCGAYGYKQSYESTRFATLYFVPVIPLGSQKITSECPHCKARLGVSKGKWRRFQKRDLPNAIAAYDADHQNVETAHELLAAAVGCHSRDTLRSHGPVIEASLAEDTETQALLALAYSHLCMDEEADSIYLKALENDPSEALTEQSALHMKAKEQPKPKPANRLLQSIPVLIVPLILLSFFGNMLGKAISSDVSDAYVVNGLDVPYDVTINGKDYRLKANSYRRIDNLRFGTNSLTVGPESPIEPSQFSLKTSWKDRMTGQPSVIVNPDKAAVVIWQRDEYTSDNREGRSDYSFEVGEVSYEYTGIDFFMREYPEQIEVSSYSTNAFRTRLATLKEYDSLERLHILLNNESEDTAMSYLANKLRAEPDAPELLPYGASILPLDQFTAAIEPQLLSKPINIDYHRFYQNALETSAPEHDLYGEYQARIAEDPTNNALLYLLARVDDNPASSLSGFKKAYSGSGAHGYAAYALAYHCLLSGTPDTAQQFMDSALKRNPGNSSFEPIKNSVLVAIGNYREIESAAANALKNDPYNVAAFTQYIAAKCNQSRQFQPSGEIDRFCKKLVSDRICDKATATQLKNSIHAHADTQRTDPAAYREHIHKAGSENSKFEIALIDGRLSDALAELESRPAGGGSYPELLLYTLAQQQRETAIAKQCLAIAIERLSQGSKEERKWATWLNAEQAPKLSELIYASADPMHHYVVLAAFGERFAHQKSNYHAHARKINYTKDFYSMALADTL